MKKNIIKLSFLTLVLTIISYIVIVLLGDTHTLVFDANNKVKELIVENNDGIVELLEKKETNNKYIVKFKAIKSGKSYVYADYGEYKEGKTLYIHKNMVITNDTYFGKSTGSEVIPISLSIILIYILYLLVKRYRYYIKENIYQYKNIAYIGIMVFLSIFLINNINTIFNYQGLFETINKTITSTSFVSFILLPIAFIMSILVTISNIQLIRKEGISLRNLLGLFLGLFICILSILPDFIYRLLMNVQVINIYNLNSPGPYIYNFIETVIYLTITYLECILVGTIIMAIKSIKIKVDYNKDYIIILGCKIKKDGTLTPLLKGRVDRAIEFRNKQLESTGKDLIFIPSGGKGDDEIIPEAEAIKNYLLEQGIKEKNIIVEDKSKNTYENIKFSNKLIDKKNANICFSTTNYHVLRAGLIATEQGLKIEGIGSKTKSYFWINAFIREFIGTMHKEKKKHIILFSSIILVIIIMIIITYFGNNL